jgi:uncharacterized RDD family membrane protein YckC
MYSSDKLTIETPEQTMLEFPLAGIGSRSLALAIDSALQGGAILSVALIASLLSLAGFLPEVGKQWTYALLILAAFLVEFGYFAFFEAVWNGQTPGKRWTHLRVLKDSGRPISVQDAILRNLLRIVDSLPTLYAIGIVTSLISQQNKRLGDYLAGTVVVHEKPMATAQLAWQASATSLIAGAQPKTLTPAELQLVEAFLERRTTFTDDVRGSMARQIVDKLNNGTAASPESLSDPEKYLEYLAEHGRNLAHFR